jgi:hypothetical protein
MIPNPTSAVFLIILGVPVLILVMFLPAFLELRRPRDRGPRMIMTDLQGISANPQSFVTIVNVEEELFFDQSLLQRLTKIIEVLPCLEV